MAADSPTDPSGAFNPYATPKARLVPIANAPAEFALFLRWEKLRVLYNLILLATVALVLVMWHPEEVLYNTSFLATLIFGCLGANVCFCIGPVVNAYAHWFGLRHVAVTGVLFVLGSLLSMFLAAMVVLSQALTAF